MAFGIVGRVLGAVWAKAPWVAGAGVAAGTVAGGAAVVDVRSNGAEGWVGNAIEWLNRVPGEGAARANVGIKFEGFYAFLENIGQFLMNITDGKVGSGLMNWARKSQGLEPLSASETSSDADGGSTDVTGADTPANGVDPAITNSIAPEFTTATGNSITSVNEITLENLATMEEFDSIGEVGHKAGLVVQGAVSETLSIGSSALGHVADFADWAVMGGIENLTGIDTGYDERDLSTSFHNVVMENVAPKPELVTAWDRVAFGAGQVGSYFIPGAAVAGTGAKITVGLGAGISTAMVPETP